MRGMLVSCDKWVEFSKFISSKTPVSILIESDETLLCVVPYDGYCVRSYLNGFFEPNGLFIEKDSRGKPYVYDELGYDSGLYLNWSHSGGVLLIGLTVEGDVGVDIEEIREIRFDDVVWAFHDNELSIVEDTGIFAAWVQKESYLKREGVGLVDYVSEYDSCEGTFLSGRYVFRHSVYEWSICLDS